MPMSSNMLEIRVLGRFSISENGKTVSPDWTDETLKVLFCSFLSPQSAFVTWERICRSIWNVPATRSSQLRLMDMFIQPLVCFLIRELGVNPLLIGEKGIGIDPACVRIDSHAFYKNASEGIRLQLCGNSSNALVNFQKAAELYKGPYLPGIPGKIIAADRFRFNVLFQIVSEYNNYLKPLDSARQPNGTARCSSRSLQ